MALWFVFLLFQFTHHFAYCQINFCQKNCFANEVYSANVSQCQNTCFNVDFNSTSNCVTAPGCVCKAGYIRDQDNFQCIPLRSCSIRKGHKNCPDNEYYTDCDAGCPKTCQTRNVAIRCRCVSGCACRTGFVRSDITFQCIPIDQCQSEMFKFFEICES